MNNPFFSYSETEKTEYLSRVCSVNSLVLAKLTVKGIDDEVEGKRAMDIFSAKIISEDILRNAERMKIDTSGYSFRDLPKFVADNMMSDDIVARRLSESIAMKYGNRLGLILLTLRQGDKVNQEARGDWTQAHWEYWRNLKNVILTGGLASGILGKKFKEQIQYVFDLAGEHEYNVTVYENSSHIGAIGCSKLVREANKNFAVLDMGQTNIKRLVLTKRSGELSNVKELTTEPSINMELDFSNSQENYSRALELHRYILNVLVDTCKDIPLGDGETGEVIISIANYVVGGTLNTYRGGYAKLSLLGHNYASLLSDELSSRLHRPYRVRLVHDGTAIALNFAGSDDTVCLSLGTAFGVGFPPEYIGKIMP
ncbi:MAG: hypothetical protein Q4D44_01080 [Eubacteriales bacterium]|nr:hypothetical protein [Eubacteriales bacterium]